MLAHITCMKQTGTPWKWIESDRQSHGFLQVQILQNKIHLHEDICNTNYPDYIDTHCIHLIVLRAMWRSLFTTSKCNNKQRVYTTAYWHALYPPDSILSNVTIIVYNIEMQLHAACLYNSNASRQRRRLTDMHHRKAFLSAQQNFTKTFKNSYFAASF